MALLTNYTTPKIDYFSKFSSKAEIYDQYRWDFHPKAIAKLSEIVNLTEDSFVADIGSGTGILTAHFVNNVKKIYAIEPNAEMRQIAINKLSKYSCFISINGLAEASNLDDHSIDLIIVGRAIHWFNPEMTKREFSRILKSNGWLAVCRIACENLELLEALKTLKKTEYGWNVAQDKSKIIEKTDLQSYYFGKNGFQNINYSSIIQENWQQFIKRICSYSPAPNPDHPLYNKFEQKAKELFNSYSQNGILNIKITTEIKLGKLR